MYKRQEYAHLFGVAEAQRDVAGRLRQADGPAFVSLEGLGGMGKTALARAVAFALAEDSDFDGIAWISARQTWLNDRGAIETTPDAATSLADIVALSLIHIWHPPKVEMCDRKG